MKHKKTIVFTSGPCGGKTTLLEELASRGLTVVPETARLIIEEEQKKDSDCLPWRNLYSFQQKVAKIQRELEHSYDDKTLFLDRGIIDGHGFSVQGKVATPDLVFKVGIGRYSLVLLLDPIPNYKTDESRKETPEMAREIHNHLGAAYRGFGYNTHTIPVITAENVPLAIKMRADYVTKLLEGKIL
jgi:predicted ATPase